jgi:hypothetical protein
MNTRTMLTILAGAAGGAVAIGLMEAFAASAAFPLFAVPFATSIVLVMGSPEAGPAQPRALVGGHLVSTLVGLAVLTLFGPGPWAAAVAVGLAIVAMQLTDTFHPPAGIDPRCWWWRTISRGPTCWRRSAPAPCCSRPSPSSGISRSGATTGRTAGGEADAGTIPPNQDSMLPYREQVRRKAFPPRRRYRRAVAPRCNSLD